MSKLNEEIIFNGETVRVVGEYYPARRGSREYGTGLRLEPDEEATIEIEEVWYQGVDVTNLLENQIDKLVELLEEK